MIATKMTGKPTPRKAPYSIERIAELNEVIREILTDIDGLVDDCRALGIEEITVDGWQHQQRCAEVLGRFFARCGEGKSAALAKRRA